MEHSAENNEMKFIKYFYLNHSTENDKIYKVI